ncbi:MAG: hypothetical protein GY757_39755 [bacterium]|nr:hypothetical protein [bacterium]
MNARLESNNVREYLQELGDCLLSIPEAGGRISPKTQEKIDLGKRSYILLNRLLTEEHGYDRRMLCVGSPWVH